MTDYSELNVDRVHHLLEQMLAAIAEREKLMKEGDAITARIVATLAELERELEAET